MSTYSSVCEVYSRRIGNEVGWLSNVVNSGTDKINISSTPLGKLFLGALNNQAKFASCKMQIVYLVDLFDAFMQDYIEARDNVEMVAINRPNFFRDHLKSLDTAWSTFCSQNHPLNQSKSFMNITYSLFVIENKYGIKYPSYLSPLVLELGSMRNCLVHYDGELSHNDKGGDPFRKTLNRTLKYINFSGDKINDININNYINKVIFDLQTFVDLCGGKIDRPGEQANET